MGYAEDMGYDSYDIPEYVEAIDGNLDRFCEWVTEDEKYIKYEDLETSHIKNIIKRFKFTREQMPCLFAELDKRVSKLN